MATTKQSDKPKALLCGMLETGGNILFLKRKGKDGKEAIEMPCVLGSTSTDPMGQLSEAFKKQTGIAAHPVHIVMEGRHNIGTAKNPEYVPVIVYEMENDEPLIAPDPGKGYSGFVKMPLLKAKGARLSENASWMLEEGVMVDG